MENQQQTNQSIGLFEWQKTAGLWSSYIHINFVGDIVRTVLRNDVAILDENMFVTAWILEILLEAQEEGIITVPEDNVNLAVNALLGFRDHNYPSPCPISSFWSQTEVNGTWQANPSNVGYLMSLGGQSGQAFYIPADTDDTAINLSIGTSLYNLQNDFPSSFSSWKNMNTGNQSMEWFTNALKEYSYKPFSKDSNVNTIDPRCYYWIQEYLQTLDSTATNTSFITTWLLDINTDKTSYYHNYAMPFNVNNVDASVAANTIQGLSRSLIYNPNTDVWFDDELQNVYRDTVDLISWVINRRLLDDRPDLVLLYYMGNYNFYWFVSRTVYLLNSNSDNLPYPVMSYALDTLKDSMRTSGTQAIMDNIQYDNDITHNWAYWDNFLGVNDTVEGKPVNHADDRISTTSVAINALIDTWTSKTSKCNYNWDPSTPAEVKTAVEQGVNWLQRYSDGIHYRAENAFFSGSVKGDDLPFWFPQNYVTYLNGTELENIHEFRSIDEIGDEVITGFSGIVSNSEYSSLIQDRWFGMETPTTWDGYNVSANNTLIYWSSPDLTYATSIVAMGRYLQLC